MIDFSAAPETLAAAYLIGFVAVVSAFGFVSHIPETRRERHQRFISTETVPIRIVQAVRATRKETK